MENGKPHRDFSMDTISHEKFLRYICRLKCVIDDLHHEFSFYREDLDLHDYNQHLDVDLLQKVLTGKILVIPEEAPHGER